MISPRMGGIGQERSSLNLERKSEQTRYHRAASPA
jgi:hypothetical protein